jgi:hypothetical protein
MTDKIDVAGLRALLEKATPGPWLQGSGDGVGTYIYCDNALGTAVAATHFNPDFTGWTYQQRYNNAALITAAVNALAALLDAAEAKAGLEGEHKAGDAVFYSFDGLQISAQFVGYDEGWCKLQFADESHATVRPSHVVAALSERPQ